MFPGGCIVLGGCIHHGTGTTGPGGSADAAVEKLGSAAAALAPGGGDTCDMGTCVTSQGQRLHAATVTREGFSQGDKQGSSSVMEIPARDPAAKRDSTRQITGKEAAKAGVYLCSAPSNTPLRFIILTGFLEIKTNAFQAHKNNPEGKATEKNNHLNPWIKAALVD